MAGAVAMRSQTIGIRSTDIASPRVIMPAAGMTASISRETLPSIRALSASEAQAAVPALAEILLDCVAGGASVSFMADCDRDRAEAFWRSVADGVCRGDRILLVASDDDSDAICGTVQIVFATPDNQPHRADIAKMLVPRRARRAGVGAALLHAVDRHSRAAGRTLLVLDTVTGSDADRLYARHGWTRVGTIPEYALFPDGRLCATTVFFKNLATETQPHVRQRARVPDRERD